MTKAARAVDAEASGRPFPPELVIHRAEMIAACGSGDDPAEWPEGVKFLEAHAPNVFARPLIKHFHHELRNCSIAYLWREEMGDGTRVKLGTAQRASAMVSFLGSVDFILCFNHAAWKVLSFEQRVALVDHELSHCTVDSESGLPATVLHDVEEFGGIVRRYGLWKPDLQSFGDCVRSALQLDMFGGPAPVLSDFRSVAKAVVDQVNAGALGPDISASLSSAPMQLHRDGPANVADIKPLAGE